MDKSEELLRELYKNVTMGKDSIINLMDKVSDKKMRSEMTTELDRYREFAGIVTEKLGEAGLKPEEPSAMAKFGSKAGMAFNTMLDVSTSHIAEMMINGATMGIINIEKQLNDGGYSAEARKVANEILDFEKDTVERLGSYL